MIAQSDQLVVMHACMVSASDCAEMDFGCILEHSSVMQSDVLIWVISALQGSS